MPIGSEPYEPIVVASWDTKPSPADSGKGRILVEFDTGALYVSSGSLWQELATLGDVDFIISKDGSGNTVATPTLRNLGLSSYANSDAAAVLRNVMAQLLNSGGGNVFIAGPFTYPLNSVLSTSIQGSSFTYCVAIPSNVCVIQGNGAKLSLANNLNPNAVVINYGATQNSTGVAGTGNFDQNIGWLMLPGAICEGNGYNQTSGDQFFHFYLVDGLVFDAGAGVVQNTLNLTAQFETCSNLIVRGIHGKQAGTAAANSAAIVIEKCWSGQIQQIKCENGTQRCVLLKYQESEVDSLRTQSSNQVTLQNGFRSTSKVNINDYICFSGVDYLTGAPEGTPIEIRQIKAIDPTRTILTLDSPPSYIHNTGEMLTTCTFGMDITTINNSVAASQDGSTSGPIEIEGAVLDCNVDNYTYISQLGTDNQTGAIIGGVNCHYGNFVLRYVGTNSTNPADAMMIKATGAPQQVFSPQNGSLKDCLVEYAGQAALHVYGASNWEIGHLSARNVGYANPGSPSTTAVALILDKFSPISVPFFSNNVLVHRLDVWDDQPTPTTYRAVYEVAGCDYNTIKKLAVGTRLPGGFLAYTPKSTQFPWISLSGKHTRIESIDGIEAYFNGSAGFSGNTTLGAPVSPQATSLRVASSAGFSAGQNIYLDYGNKLQESQTIASVGTATLSVDTVTTKQFGNATQSGNITVSTNNAGELIYVVVEIASTTLTVSSISSPNVSWQTSARKTVTNTNHLEVWWGTAAAALNNESITINLSTSGAQWRVIVAGIVGANLAAPFDTNASIPASATGSSTTPSVTISTSNPNDMILGLFCQGGSGTWTPGSGFSFLIAPSTYTNPVFDGEYEIVSATQTNLAVSVTSSVSNAWAAIGDAIAASPALSLSGSGTIYGHSQGAAVRTQNDAVVAQKSYSIGYEKEVWIDLLSFNDAGTTALNFPLAFSGTPSVIYNTTGISPTLTSTNAKLNTQGAGVSGQIVLRGI